MDDNIFSKNTLELIKNLKNQKSSTKNTCANNIKDISPDQMLRIILAENYDRFKNYYTLSEQADINHTNLSKALNGASFPESYFLKLLITLKFNSTQINQLLKEMHKPVLYPTNSQRDQIIIQGIENQKSVTEINLMLKENSLLLL